MYILVIQIKILYSKHALEKMDAYGIQRQEVYSIIERGMKWKEKDADKYHARMAGVECVFTKKEDTLFVVTVYPSGGKK